MNENNKLFVSNLNYRTTEDALRTAFRKFGTIIDVKICKQPIEQKSRGFGFVTFEQAMDARAALAEMHQTDLDGRELRVDWARERERPARAPRGY